MYHKKDEMFIMSPTMAAIKSWVTILYRGTYVGQGHSLGFAKTTVHVFMPACYERVQLLSKLS